MAMCLTVCLEDAPRKKRLLSLRHLQPFSLWYQPKYQEIDNPVFLKVHRLLLQRHVHQRFW